MKLVALMIAACTYCEFPTPPPESVLNAGLGLKTVCVTNDAAPSLPVDVNVVVNSGGAVVVV